MRYGPIYGCFLDREYSTSVNFRQQYEEIRRFLYAALLATDSYLYCSLSAIGECPGLADFPEPFLRTLLSEQLLVTVSDYNDPDQFLVSRRLMYRHDAPRYPLYFERPDRDALSLWEPGYVKSASSTGYLARALPVQFNGKDNSTVLYSSMLEDIVRRAIAERDNRAITIALFEPSFHEMSLKEEIDYRLRNTISHLYTRHFLSLFSGVLMTELPYFLMRDRHFNDFRGPSYRLWRHVVPPAWVRMSPEYDVNHLRELIQYRDDTSLSVIRGHLRQIDENSGADPDGAASRRSAEQVVAAAARQSASEDAGRYFASVRTRLDEQLGEQPTTTVPRVIVTCANAAEEDALRYALAGERGYVPRLVFAGETTYWDLGRLGDAQCFLVRTDTGSIGGAASLATLQDAIAMIGPSVVASCGICFGLRPNLQRLADVIVATRLRTYEKTRVGTANDGSVELRERGQAADVDPILLLRMTGLLSDVRHVAFGEVASGEKLVDQLEFRDELLRRFPDSHAGEMEGSGLISACGRRRVPWIMVKAISDFGDGQKKPGERNAQRKAARASAEVLKMLISGGCFAGM